MAAPTTGFEDTGEWTTLAQETDFLHQIATETSATLTVAGTTQEGREIHRVDLGTGTDQTMLIVTLQHGNEPASREAALMQIRDLAYSTDPAVQSYLADHRVVWLTNVNADGLPNWRETQNLVNTNRDHFRLEAPETVVMAEVIQDTLPHLIVDAHEYVADTYNWLGRGNALPGTHDAVQTLGSDLYLTARDQISAAGWSANQYFVMPRAALSTSAGYRHSVGLLIETNAKTDTPAQRVAIQRMSLDICQEWHQTNATACTAAGTTSREYNRTTRDPVPLFVGERTNTGTLHEIDRLQGYQLHEPLPQKFIEAFSIVVDEDNFVSVHQEARLILPVLLDPLSDDVQVEASRVVSVVPMPATPLVASLVKIEGSLRPIHT